jgi:hypothetical protein
VAGHWSTTPATAEGDAAPARAPGVHAVRVPAILLAIGAALTGLRQQHGSFSTKTRRADHYSSSRFAETLSRDGGG